MHFSDFIFNSTRKIMYMSEGFPAVSGTGTVIKFKDKFYFCCLYHSVSSSGKFEFNKIKDLAVLYKTYLEIDPKTINSADKFLLFPNPEQFSPELFVAMSIDDDLMLGEEFILIEIIGKNDLTPIGYLDFNEKSFSEYILKNKEPIIDEKLFICGFPFEKNEIHYNDDGNVSEVRHELSIYQGVCQKDNMGFYVKIEKNDDESSIDFNGVSGGMVFRITNSKDSEWVGIAVRANNEIIRFIPYHLVAPVMVKIILERESKRSNCIFNPVSQQA